MLVGYISRLFHDEAMIEWYPYLNKSALNPPDIVFPIVWGVIYLMMGISVGRLYSRRSGAGNGLFWLFAIQLFLNITWNFLFFYMESPFIGLVNLLVLDALAILYFMVVLKVDRISAYLFLPYVVWMLFATYLNFYIVVNN